MEGRQLGRYTLIEEIGHGGMAVVWRGVDTTLKREVAVKILHPHLSRKESNRQRFAREARVVATLHHDNIVEIYDFSGGQDVADENGATTEAYIVTEYIRGRTLADFLEKTPAVPVEVGVLVVLEICDALAHAHASGVVHRDIKPENVMIRQDGCLKLMDFGIARVNDGAAATMTGTLIGSPNYMSPEQYLGQELDARSDLFSIGILLYRLVTGALPFDGPNPAAILRALSEVDPVPPDQKNPLVGRALAATIRKALAKKPDDRHATITALATDLRAAIADPGLGSGRDELQKYFADPAGYSTALRASLVTRYAAAGNARARRRDIPGAMELWSRVLELDPANADVRAALNALSRGRRTSRAVLATGGVVAAVALLGGAGVRGWRWAWTTPVPSATPTALAVVESPAPGAGTPVLATPASTVTPAPPPTAHPHVSIAPRPVRSFAIAATPSATPTQVAMIATPAPVPSETPFPAGTGALRLGIDNPADIYVDDVKKGETLILKNRPIVLAAGDHSLRVVPPPGIGCKPLVGTVSIAAGAVTQRVRVGDEVRDPDHVYLDGCPMRFRIDAGDATAAIEEVDLDGKKISVNEDGQWVGLSGKHELRVLAKGYEPFVTHIELVPRNRDVVGMPLPIAKAQLTPKTK